MAAPGKVYYIKSHLNGLVLDVEGGQTHPGVRVLMWHQKPDGADNQLFYDDPQTGTIRSKLNGYSLDIQGDSLVLNPFQPGNPNQQWFLNGFKLQNRFNPNMVLDIASCDSNPGARVGQWNYNGQANQHWNLEFVRSRHFRIRSELSHKVLDIEGANRSPGAKVLMWTQKPHAEDNQLWYEDQYGVIRSKLNDFALDASSDRLVMNPYNPSNPRQQWVINGNRIVNRYNQSEVLDIVYEDRKDGAQLCAWQFKGSKNQLWRIEYV